MKSNEAHHYWMSCGAPWITSFAASVHRRCFPLGRIDPQFKSTVSTSALNREQLPQSKRVFDMNQPMAARTFPTTIVCMLALFFGFYVPLAVFGSEEIEILNAQRENDGVLVHSVKSPHQSGKTAIQVLLPDRMEQGKRYPVV